MIRTWTRDRYCRGRSRSRASAWWTSLLLYQSSDFRKRLRRSTCNMCYRPARHQAPDNVSRLLRFNLYKPAYPYIGTLIQFEVSGQSSAEVGPWPGDRRRRGSADMAIGAEAEVGAITTSDHRGIMSVAGACTCSWRWYCRHGS